MDGLLGEGVSGVTWDLTASSSNAGDLSVTARLFSNLSHPFRAWSVDTNVLPQWIQVKNYF